MRTESEIRSCVAPGRRLAGLLLATAAAAAARAETNAAVALPEIVVTATRGEEAVLELPFVADTRDAEEIQLERMARTTPEALRETPAVMIQKTAHGQGSPYIRGFTGFRTLMLIDGIRLNNSTFRDGPNQYWNTVDPLSIGRLELVKGPASALYGSDAIGGTANALTLSPFDFGTGRGAEGRAYYRYSTAEDSHTGRAEAGGRLDDRTGARAGVSYKSYGDLRSGGDSDRQSHTGYDEYDVDARMDHYFADEVRLTLGFQTVNQDDAWRTHATIYARPFHGTTVGTDKERSLDQFRQLVYGRLEALDRAGFARDARLTVSYHRQEESQFRIKKDDVSEDTGVDVGTLGVDMQAVSETGLGEWTYGAEYYRDAVDSYAKTFAADGSLTKTGIQGPVADDATYDNLGVYVQDLVAVAERVDLILGARYNYLAADSDKFEDPVARQRSSFSESWDAVVGNARVLYRLLPDAPLHVFAGVAQGFRAPNLSDLSRLDIARTSEIETPATDLDPEQFLCWEAGVKGDLGPVSLEGALFYTDIRDLIVRAPTGRMIEENHEVTKKNAGDGYIQGLEMAAGWQLHEQWQLWGNLTWMDGEVDGYPTSDPTPVTEPVSRLMPLTGHVGLRFDPVDTVWIEGVASLADQQDELSAADQADTQRIPPGGTPGYAVFTLRGGWRATEDLTLSAALENLADKEYRIHGSGLNEPGRNLVVAADYRF